MLSTQEFVRLQNLSALDFSVEEKNKLLHQLSSIVSFLSALQKFSSGSQDMILGNHLSDSSISLRSGTEIFQNPNILFSNVKHEKIGNSIAVSSVLDN